MYILFIDDEESVLKSINRSLFKWFKDKKIIPLMANSVKVVLKELKEHGENISVIVSDQKMPDLNGNELIKIIKEKYPDIVSIILSGNTETTDIEKLVKSQIFSYITKPWEINDLKSELEKAINHYQIKKENRVLKEKINTELLLARDFQKTIMSNTLIKNFPINSSVTYTPCSSSGVSGDYYEIIKLSDSKVVILLGDVSGHGIQPAFISMALKSIIPFEYFNNKANDSFSTVDFTTWLNNRLCDYLESYPGIFLAFTCLLIDLEKNECTCTNAGQPKPVILGDNDIVIIENSNIVLGIHRDSIYTSQVVNIDKESRIFMCSDGIYPSGSNSKNYTEENFIQILSKYSGEILNHNVILDDIYKNHINEEIDDDITILSIEVK
jgi:phosphoserine phosphatase RsbU/P